MMPVRGGPRVSSGRGRRNRGGSYRGRGNLLPLPPALSAGHAYPGNMGAPLPPMEMDFTEDVQMSGNSYQPWESNFDRKRSIPFNDHPVNGPPKKLRFEGPNSLLPTPPRPVMRVPQIGNPFPRPGFRPPPQQDIVVPPGRFFGPPVPRGSPRPIGLPPRGPARFPPLSFNRPGPPLPPVGFRPSNPHRGLSMPRGGGPGGGGPYHGRVFGGVPRMFRP